MRKISLALIAGVIAFAWYMTIKNDLNSSFMADYYENGGDLYNKKQLNNQAIREYDKSIESKASIQVVKKKIDLLLEEKKYDQVLADLSIEGLSDDYVYSKQMAILDSLLDEERYKELNQILNQVKIQVRDEFNQKYYSHFIVLDGQFDDINYLPGDKTYYIVSNEDKWYLVNAKGKKSVSKAFERIIDYSSKDSLITVQEEGNNDVINLKQEVISRLKGRDQAVYTENIWTAKDKDKYSYIDAAGRVLLSGLNKASSFSSGMAIIQNDGIKIIDQTMTPTHTLEGNDFYTDQRNSGVFGGLVKTISNKENLYNAETGKHLGTFDQIDLIESEKLAVEKEGKWYFVDQRGQIISDTSYDRAYSYSADAGFAEVGGDLFIVNKDFKKYKVDNRIVPYISQDGISFLKEGDKYRMIRFGRYIND